uniref:Uncharacterized protein n=1 Tax=Oryza punctata TaxID=4537 RepID=A0A0E0KMX4_ORYPU
MTTQRVSFVTTATFPATALIAFGSFKFIANDVSQLVQVSDGVIGCTQALCFPAGAEFCFGSLDFTANKVGILKLASSRTPPLIMLPRLHFGVSNFAATAIKIATTKTPINNRREGAAPPQLPHELGPRWVGLLDEFVCLSNTETESSESTPTTPHSPQDVFVVLHPEMDAKKQEREEEERRIKQ